MKTFLTKAALGIALSATALTAAVPADAQNYRRSRGNNDAGVAIIAGIAGLAIGAAIASSGDDRGRYDRRHHRERQRDYRGQGYNGSYNNGYDNGGNYYADRRDGRDGNRRGDGYRGYGGNGYSR